MIILGLNAYHADAAAAIIVDGRLVAAVEEERFRRIKHWAGFPAQSIRFCLAAAGISVGQLDAVAISRNPRAAFFRKAAFALRHRPPVAYLRDRIRNLANVSDPRGALAEACDGSPDAIRAKIFPIEHHRAHLASSFFVSPYDSAAVASVDALGDFASAMRATGEGGRLSSIDRIHFPHSLGFFYTAGTQFLGFPKYGDEYKVMGLAAYAEPDLAAEVRQVIRIDPKGGFALDLDYFRHAGEGIEMTWSGGEPIVGPLFSSKWESLLGPARKPDEPLTDRHRIIAASIQAVFEEAYFVFLNRLHRSTGSSRLCLSGGCAMNSVANGKLFDRTPFSEVYLPPAPGDAGTAIGAAFSVWHERMGRPRGFVMDRADWGPGFSTEQIRAAVARRDGELSTAGCRVTAFDDEDRLIEATAAAIADGKIVGWFQGGMEWGPRALGNRSILADPRRAEMREILNARIKRREVFRPFAPSVLAEAASDFFETNDPDPFMLKVVPVKKEKREVIPAVTHVDGTGRLQTVHRSSSPRYHALIEAFSRRTGVPVVLNTSFNENEPIVCSPEEALDCFFRTKMDVLVLGNEKIERTGKVDARPLR